MAHGATDSMDVSSGHLDTEGTGKDGSGAIAIKMIHTDSKLTIAADTIRLIFSICLLIFSTISVIYAIATSSTTMPDSFPPWSQYLCLAVSLFILGVLEGLQIGVVELAHKDPNKYRKLYPRAAKLLAFENKGRNVERFLMGRQVLVVFTVFVAARITTFDGFWADVPQSLIHGLMFSGFLGVILVVIVAQLTPQVLAAAYPIEFMNLPGMNIAFGACLAVEATGLVHAVWFLCVVVKRMVYKCVCGKAELQKVDSGFVSRDIITAAKTDNDNAEVIDMEDEEMEMVARSNKSKAMQVEGGINDAVNELMKYVGDKKGDLMDICGDGGYMSPAQFYDKFETAGLNAPQFLLSPDHDQHIPPHVVAMMLMKMYTEKCLEVENQKKQDTNM